MKHSIFADHSPLLSDWGVLSHPFNTKTPALFNQVFSSDISLNNSIHVNIIWSVIQVGHTNLSSLWQNPLKKGAEEQVSPGVHNKVN